jgi:hypothetical protein
MGMPLVLAARPALNIASTHGALKVPMLSTRLLATVTRSSTSSSAWAMSGDAPIASKAFAVLFITT